MDESLTFATLTLMLLRASIPHPERLRPEYGVVLLPDDTVLSKGEALNRIAEMRGPLVFTGQARNGNLVVFVTEPSIDEEPVLEWRVRAYSEVLERMNSVNAPDALAQVEGFRESMTVPVNVLQRWFGFAKCWQCSLSLSKAEYASTRGVIAVLRFGSQAAQYDTLPRADALVRRPGLAQPSATTRPVVDFFISELPTSDRSIRRWLATFGTAPDITELEICLTMSAQSAVSREVDVVFHPHGHSNPKPLIDRLSDAYGLQVPALEVPRLDSIRARGTVLGQNLERRRRAGTVAGEFTEAATGTWFVVEASLLPDLPSHSRLFLALSPETGQGALVSAGQENAAGVIAALYALVSR